MFLFLDTPRSIKASTATAEQFFQKLRNKHEFTVLVTLKQTHLNSGVIFSIHHLDHRYVWLLVSCVFIIYGEINTLKRSKQKQDIHDCFKTARIILLHYAKSETQVIEISLKAQGAIAFDVAKSEGKSPFLKSIY